MLKTTIIALFAAVAVAGAAVPASADSVFGDDSSTEMREFIADSIVAQLQQKGINVTAVEDWSGLIRAYVTLEDGSQVMQFYAPGSLEQVSL